MDFTNEFDKHLESMHASRYCQGAEIEAAVFIYERLKTAQVICKTVFTEAPSQDAVTAVFAELCTEARGQGSE